MSIPLPPSCSGRTRQRCADNTAHDKAPSGLKLKLVPGEESSRATQEQKRHQDETVHVYDIFLDPDERYEVFVVKAAERPHLCLYGNNDNETAQYCKVELDEAEKDENSDNDDDDDDDDDDDTPFLMDGCDIPAWRQTFAPSPAKSHQVAVWNIGSASTLFRRERQWPHLSSSYPSLEGWQRLQQILSRAPSTEAPRVSFETCRQESTTIKGMTKFGVEFERQNRPAIIMGATEGWKAMPYYPRDEQPKTAYGDGDETTTTHIIDFSGGGIGGWTFSELLRRFGSFRFRFSDTHGEMLTLETYAKYICGPEGLWDDSPLAIYDSEFGSDESLSCLVKEYTVPDCFSFDLFALAEDDEDDEEDEEEVHEDEEEQEEDKKNHDDNQNDENFPSPSSSRPPYRWILIGPPRSGTGLHIDPLWTNAWVTVLQGRKRWMLFPPATPPEAVGMVKGEPQIASSIWFHRYHAKVTSHDWPEAWRPVEILQVPGETVFVPQGWMHLVLNLDLTVAVTHNYATDCQVERLWQEVFQEESVFGKRWVRGLQSHGRTDVLERLRQQATNG